MGSGEGAARAFGSLTGSQDVWRLECGDWRLMVLTTTFQEKSPPGCCASVCWPL